MDTSMSWNFIMQINILSQLQICIHVLMCVTACVRSKMSWAEDHFSDCIAIVIAFKEWKNAKISGRFDLGGKVTANMYVMYFRSQLTCDHMITMITWSLWSHYHWSHDHTITDHMVTVIKWSHVWSHDHCDHMIAVIMWSLHTDLSGTSSAVQIWQVVNFWSTHLPCICFHTLTLNYSVALGGEKLVSKELDQSIGDQGGQALTLWCSL